MAAIAYFLQGKLLMITYSTGKPFYKLFLVKGLKQRIHEKESTVEKSYSQLTKCLHWGRNSGISTFLYGLAGELKNSGGKKS